MNQDVLIIGQGLTGSLLASALEDEGFNFTIIDEDRPYTASKNAAGIINPVTGRRFVKSWNYDLLEKIFIPAYDHIGLKIHAPVLTPHVIRLCLSSIKEENDLISQAMRYDYTSLINRCTEELSFTHHILSAFDLTAFKVDIPGMISKLRKIWMDKNVLYPTAFNYDELVKKGKHWTYQGLEYEAVIFCEGASIKNNPFFKYLPVIPNKGQIMWIEAKELTSEISLKHHLIVTGPPDRKWIGATYEWEFLSEVPTNDGLAELKKKFEDFVRIPYKIIDHQAGIRPTTKDRRPIIESHPMYENLWAINGLGTKGASLGPFVIKEFLNQFKREDG
ncbi:MAG: FAD-binding oxidoreductase [Saprospiraceae bacterium]